MALEKLRAGSVVQQHLACATVPSMHTTRSMPRPCQHGAWMPACPWTAKSSKVSVPEPWGPPRCRADSHFFFQFRASLTARGPYVSGSSFLYLHVGPNRTRTRSCLEEISSARQPAYGIHANNGRANAVDMHGCRRARMCRAFMLCTAHAPSTYVRVPRPPCSVPRRCMIV
jgi:hypothetical protein